MPFLCRLTETFESVSRLIAARGSRIAALEKFYRAHTAAEPPATAGILDADFESPDRGLVSVVILSLNGAEMLASLFRSIRTHNTWPDLEFLIVDHGGDDDTRQVLSGLSTEFDIRHLVPGRNFSFAFSCNRAAQLARGETLLFLNNDIEFTEDVIPQMVAAARSTGGLAGLKLWEKSPEGVVSDQPQIGIRFRWNLHQGWTVPYETKPGPMDTLRMARPSTMPAVTAAIVACPRERFLALGGFSEEYLYAYEDVDFGLKVMAAGLPSVSLNNRSATHIVGATRFKRARGSRRRRWHRYNLSVFRARCGYLCRRLAWSGLFGGNGFDWGRRPAVAVIVPRGEHAISLAGSAFAFVDVKKAGPLGVDIYGYDVVISSDPAFDFSHARHLSPMAVTVGWVHGQQLWSADPSYDLFVAEDEDAALEFSSRTGLPVEVLRREDGQAALMRIITRFLQDRHRIAIVGGEEDGRQHLLANGLKRKGMSVRCSKPGAYPSRFAMRDDFVIWLEEAVQASPSPDACHVTAFDLPENASWRGDIELGGWKGDFGPWFDLLVREMEGYHSRRMAGPADHPLVGASLRDDTEARSFWQEFVDPTAWLIELP